MIRPGALVCCVVALASVTSCSVSVSAVKDTQFRTVWSRDWAIVNTSAEPLLPSGSSPGACNKGAVALDCVSTGKNMVAALSKLGTDLAAVTTPRQYTAASTGIQHAIQIDIKGITDRDTAIETQNSILFTAAIAEVQQAANLFAQGYAQFPQAIRPTPQPFNGALSG